MASALAPLRQPPFGRLLAGYAVNQIGDFVGIVALALLVYDQTTDALATTALFITMQFAPALLAPLLTAHLDQVAVRRSLPGLYLCEGLLFVALALLARHFALWAVLVLAFVDGVLMLTARGVSRAAVNAVLEGPGLLHEGNALLNVAFSVTSVSGYAIGGVLTAAIGADGALYVDAASFGAVALLLATARGLPRTSPEEHESFRSRLSGGLRFAWQHPLVRLLVVGETLAVLLFTVVVPIEVVYAKETLHTGDSGYGLLLSTWGAGAVLGSLLFVRVARRSPYLLIGLSTAAVGVGYLGMGLSRSLALACAMSIVGGLGNGVQWVSVMTAVQGATPAALQARIAGLLESTTAGMTGVGFLVGGIVATLTEPHVPFVGAGIAILAAVVIGGALRPALSATPRPRPAAPSDGA